MNGNCVTCTFCWCLYSRMCTTHRSLL